MHCAVIFCLIAVGYVGAVGPVYFKDREPRHATQQVNQAGNSSPYPYVTYPDYSQKALRPTPATTVQTVPTTVQTVPTAVQTVPTTVQTVPTTVQTVPTIVQTVPTTVQTVDNTQSSNNSVTPTQSSVFDTVKPYFQKIVQFSATVSNYLLQVLGVTFIGQSIVGLVCAYTSVCKFLQNSEQARGFGRSYGSSNFLNEMTSVLTKAVDLYSNMQE